MQPPDVQDENGITWRQGPGGEWWWWNGSLWVSAPPGASPRPASSVAAPPVRAQPLVAPATASKRPAASNPAQKRRVNYGCLTFLVLFVIVVVILIVAISGGGGGTTYSAAFQPGGITAISAQEDHVYITVKNTGSTAGKPTCTINLESPVIPTSASTP